MDRLWYGAPLSILRAFHKSYTLLCRTRARERNNMVQILNYTRLHERMGRSKLCNSRRYISTAGYISGCTYISPAVLIISPAVLIYNYISGCTYISPAVLIYIRLYLYNYISTAVFIYLRLYLYISGCTYIIIYLRLYLYISCCTYIYPAVLI